MTYKLLLIQIHRKYHAISGKKYTVFKWFKWGEKNQKQTTNTQTKPHPNTQKDQTTPQLFFAISKLKILQVTVSHTALLQKTIIKSIPLNTVQSQRECYMHRQRRTVPCEIQYMYLTICNPECISTQISGNMGFGKLFEKTLPSSSNLAT